MSKKFVSLRTNPKSHQERESKTSLIFEVINLMDLGEQKCHVVEPQSTYTLNTWNNPENLAITKLMVIK